MGRRRLVLHRSLRSFPIDRLLTLLGSLPIGVERLVQTATGPWAWQRLRVVPTLLVILAVLTIIPVGQALVEIIVRPVTVAELVDRNVGLSTRLVSVDGFALLVPLDADPPPDASGSPYVYHWYPVRDTLQELRLVLVRSIVTPEALRTRSVVARVVDDVAAVSRTTAGLATRGAPGAETVAPVLLIEEEQGTQSVRDLDTLANLGDAIGEVVRIRITFEDGIATCVGRGDCNARTLAGGIGSWDNLAHDERGDTVVVRTIYPPSVAPFHGVGHHAQDRETVGRLLALPLVRGLLGWGHVLQAAHVEHDLGLPIDHLWLGPILFTAAAAILLFGRRLPYPRFRPRWARIARTVGPPNASPVMARATGRITPPDASPFEITDLPATLRAEPPRGTSLSLEIDGERREFLIPRDLGGLGGTELGDVLTVTSVRPALKVDWFGSNLLLVFEDATTRDDANAMIRETG
ncbi:MAG TPA: hypothetical protein VL687_08715 [Methylomirabilota bacterium]|nr:hypothetical protein [Methylomirabilota bacterium]